MPEKLPDFQPILAALKAANVRFVLIGGLAMAAHGSSYITQDIDIGYARDRENARAIAKALADRHPRPRDFPPDLPFQWDEKTLLAATNLTLETDDAPIDFLAEIAGIHSFEELWERSVVVELYDVSIHVASLDDLIAMKRAANRVKDQSHIPELEALRKLRQH